ncbi:hypothetical protein [Flavobacterium filum]|uniref:hypothetical protein n=1 Tax=Flavobacterium filum TaxID=370974 RepID=UPI0023F0C833|nr:hypothetical protein [Flavobacterium filum]
MKKQFAYHCPKDILKMPKIDDKFYCNLCNKNVTDLTQDNDLDVLKKAQEMKSPTCIHIQKDRLPLVTTRFPRWRIFIFVLINFKAYFLQKMYSQNNDSLSFNKSQDKKYIRKLKGQIKDSKTGRPVKRPTIDLYRGDVKLQTLKGDRDGKFTFLIESNANLTDTVSIAISSKHYESSKIATVPLFKKTTSVKTTISRNRKKKKFYSNETLTGDVRFLD